MTEISVKRTLAVVFSALLALSMVAPFAAATAGAPAGADAGGGIAEQPTQTGSASLDGAAAGGGLASSSQGEVDPSLTSGNASGTVEVVVRLSDAPLSAASTDVASVQSLKAHAETTQSAVLEYAASTEGVKTLQTFWVTNAVLLEVDRGVAGQSVFTDLTGMQQVERVHRNFEVSLPEPSSPLSQQVSSHVGNVTNGYNVTYGLNQTNATEVWEEYDTRGDGVKVAVLDTGVSVDHPDIELFTTDPSDPTYPGGWAEFNADGERVEGSVPHADGAHGTHTSGTVSGGNASGYWIGVAPNVSLMHGQVIPGGSGSFAQIIAGMQWAVAEDADVVSMSLGASGKLPSFIEPIRNAEAAGTIVVASSGNSGAGTSGTPGNVFDAFSIGASDADRNIASFSSGEMIDTSEDWGLLAPSDWPEEYAVPDVAAPGVSVLSAVPAGTFEDPDAIWGTASGTSMSAPHVAGGIALMLAAADSDVDVQRIKNAFTESAHAPENADPMRYGDGLVDIEAATDLVAADSGVQGQIVDSTGEPIEGATVQFATGISVETDANGEFTLHGDAGTYTVAASAFGYSDNTTSATVTDGSYTSVTLALADQLDATTASAQPSEVGAGGDASVTLRVANLQSLTVAQSGDYPTDGATLYVDGQTQTFGEAVAFDDYTGEVTVTVATEDGVTGSLSLTHTLEGEGDSTTVETGPTAVYGDPVPVAVVTTEENAELTVLDQRLEMVMPPRYEPEFVAVEDLQSWDGSVDMEAVNSYEALVIQNLGSDEAFVSEFVDATDSARIGTVWLDNYGSMSNAIRQRAAATGDPDSATDWDDLGQSLDVRYGVTQSHPIVEGVAAKGEEVTLYTAPTLGGLFTYSGFHSYFSEYEGLDAESVATVSAGTSDAHSGLAVDRYTSTVLAASLGRSTQFAPDQAFTEDANQILSNAVMWAANPPAVIPEETQPAQMAPGKSITMTFDVANLDEYEVGLVEGSGGVAESNLKLTVNGKIAAFDQALAYDGYTGDFTVTVTAENGTFGAMSLDHTFLAGEDDTYDLNTGPTSVYEAPMEVPEDTDSVQTAIELTPSGMEIIVGDGVHQGSLVIAKNETWGIGSDGITIRGEDGADAVLKPSVNEFGTTIDLMADDVTIENLTLNTTWYDAADDEVNYFPDGIQGFGVDGLTVRDTEIRHGDVWLGSGRSCFYGICSPAEPATNTMIDNVTITGGGLEADVFGGSTITDSEIHAEYTALEVGATVGVEITDTVVSTTADRPSAAFSSFYGGTADITFRNNTVLGTGTGVAFDGSPPASYTGPDSVVTDNDINVTGTGLVLNDQNGVEVYRNDIDAGTAIELAVTSFDASYSLPADTVVRYNNVDSETAVTSTYPVDTADLRLNYWGERGPAMGSVVENATTDPFLTTTPSELDYSMGNMDKTTQIGIDTHMEAGGSYALGIPGPVSGDVSDMLGAFEGVVYGWDAESQSWNLVHGNDSVSSLQGLLVIPSEDARAVMSFHSDGPGGPGIAEVEEGWNFLAAPQFVDARDAFDVTSASPKLLMAKYQEPTDHMGPRSQVEYTYEFTDIPGTSPNVSAFMSYFVYSETEGSLPAYVSTNPTMHDLHHMLDMGPQMDDSGSSSASSASVSDILDDSSELDNRTRRTVSQLLYEQMRSAVASEDVASASSAMQVADGVASDALAQADTDAEREVVRQAARGAMQRLLHDLANGELLDDDDSSQASMNRAPAAAAVAD